MDPNQAPQPNPTPGPQPPTPPQPPAPAPPVEPPVPASMPVPPAPAPQPSVSPPVPGSVTPPVTMPGQPTVMSGGEPGAGQMFQPDQPQNNVSTGAGKPKPVKLIIAAVLAILLLAGALLAFNMLSTKAEVKAADIFIEAVQDEDIDKLEKVIDPAVVKIANKLDGKQSSLTKKELYESFTGGEAKRAIDGQKPVYESLKIEGEGSNKHALVTYKMKEGKFYVLEIYVDGQPKVLGGSDSDAGVLGEDFNEAYKSYREMIKFLEEAYKD